MGADGSDLNQNAIALTTGGKTSRLLRPGDIIGESYRLKGLIGKGGMGFVFRAEHIMIGKDFALKMLAPDQVNELTWSRFQSEGRAIARLDHPNIVKIYNMGVDRGDCPYYVMDLLEGVSLADAIRDRMKFTVDDILDMFMQLASGFGYAHSHGIIHRDIKPGNIVLINEGKQFPTAKIVDFGIAKLTGKSDLHKQSLTATGEVFGSPFYMSPEQCLGTEIDQRSDIYSLGCTLFEVLCGRPPFVGENAMQTVLMHQNKPSPSIESVGGKFSSEEMEALVAKMLAKRPADRYQTMEQVLHDLDRIWQHKAVGKKVGTGFQTSVDRKLTDITAKEEEGAGQQRFLKGLLICVGAVVALFIFVAIGYTIQRAGQHGERHEVKLYQRIRDADVQKPTDPEMDDGLKKLAAVKSITSVIDAKSGKRIFHCPDLFVGQFQWRQGPPNLAELDTNASDDGQMNARGEAAVPAGVPLGFQIDAGANRVVWTHPEVLSKFAPADMTWLRLGSEDLLTEESEQARRVNAIVRAVAGWNNLQQIEFSGCPTPDQALIDLDNFPRLNYLEIRGSIFSSHVLSQRKFLRRLKFLSLVGECSPDVIFKGLKGSKAIQFVILNQCTPSADAMKSLATCPNLRVLLITSCPVDSSMLKTIATMRKLEFVDIVRTKLSPEFIPDLVKLSFVKHLYIDISNWPYLKQMELKRQLPQASLRLEDKPLD